MIRAVLFDLDDTLYPELTFVRSGFHSVAEYVASISGHDESVLFDTMWNTLQTVGRGAVFDTLLYSLDLHTDRRVKLLTYLYRSHNPKIYLEDETVVLLKKLTQSGILTGIITDGMAFVQHNKLVALDLMNLVDITICTDALGSEYWKPSPVPFEIALEFLDVAPCESAYIGDNITKDFAGANLLGMMTIQTIQHIDTSHLLDGREIGNYAPNIVADTLNYALSTLFERSI